MSSETPITITITGAAGQIGYSLVPMVCNGNITGNRKMIINLLEIPQAQKFLEGFYMELIDSAYPLVEKFNLCYDPLVAFKDCDIGLLVGSFPRKGGMVRADLLKKNANIFKIQGEAINKVAKKDIKIIVVGNPANTNAQILKEYAPTIKQKNVTSMSRLDHNRLKGQLVNKVGCKITQISKTYVWGNHSKSQVPDISNGFIENISVKDKVKDDKWLNDKFLTTIKTRGKAIIDARGKSSASSAAKACVDHMRDWFQGSNGKIVSMGVPSTGEYGIKKGVIYSHPVICKNGDYEIVKGLKINDEIKKMMKESEEELINEKKIALDFVKGL